MSGNGIAERLAIQSWCFREFKDTQSLIKALKSCGVDHLEICGAHIDLAKNREEVMRQMKEAGITLTSYGVNWFSSDAKAARRVFEFAKEAGFSTINADFDEDGLAVATALCKEFGLKIAVHNHGRKHALGSVKALERLFAKTGPELGLYLDTAWMLDSGENPVEVAKRFKDRLYGIHIKDFVFDRAGKAEDVVVGTGNLDLPALADFLKEIGYAGCISIEYEGDAANPVPALKKCVENVRKALA